MSLIEPESMDECFYFTSRVLESGEVGTRAWVFKPDCPKCKKAKLGKPLDKKTGKIKVRAKEFVCPECDYTVDVAEMGPSLEMNIQYTCPHCGNEGETTTKYELKTFKGVKSYIFTCGKCDEKIGLTKKLKAPKPPKKK